MTSQGWTERVKALEVESPALLITVTLTVPTMPAPAQGGAVHVTSLAVSVLDESPRVPALAVHVNRSGGDSSSRAVTEKVTVS
jgi:hypothetical protein